MHAVLAQSTCPSQNVQNTPGSDHFWKLRCWKSARRCGARFQVKSVKTWRSRTIFGSWDVEKVRAVSSQKCKKLTVPETLWEVVEKVHTVVARSTFPSQNVKGTTCSCSDHFWRFRCRFAWQAQGIVHLVKSEQNVRVLCRFNYNHNGNTLYYTTLHLTTQHNTPLQTTTLQPTTLHYTTPHYTPLHYTTPHYTTLHYTLHYATLATVDYSIIHSTKLHNYNYNYNINYKHLNYITHTTLATLNYTLLHHTTLNYITAPLHYILHYATLNCTTLHYTYNYNHNSNYATLHSNTLDYTTLPYPTLHYTTLHYPTLHYITLR